jgi:hypothetical protein
MVLPARILSQPTETVAKHRHCVMIVISNEGYSGNSMAKSFSEGLREGQAGDTEETGWGG